jgi:hypothetical protein
MPLRREINALAAALEDIANVDKTPEELAEQLIDTLDAVRARHNRLAVLARYTWDQETWHLAVLGPFSTTAERTALDTGAGMTGSIGHPGHGKFLLVPIYANTRDAWAAIKPSDERQAALRLAEIRRGSNFNPWAHGGPTCHCGIRRADGTARPCPVHPERNR